MSDLQVAAETRGCPLGCEPSDVLVLVGHDRIHGLPGDFDVVQCTNCTLLRTDPRPTPETIGFYYPHEYGPYVATRIEGSVTAPPRSPLVKRLLRPVIQRVFDFKTVLLPDLPPGRMLEVGSASGAFLHRMASAGWSVHGIELSAEAAQAAIDLGYSVDIGRLETAPSPVERYDLIVGWMVLEHLHDPVEGLRRLKDWATTDAYLALSVPNAGAVGLRLFKSRWYELHLPNHLYHFTPKTLGDVLRAGGWNVERVHYQRVANDLAGSSGYWLHDRGLTRLGQRLMRIPDRGRLWPFVAYPIGYLLARLRRSSRLTVWARPTT